MLKEVKLVRENSLEIDKGTENNALYKLIRKISD